MKHLFFLFVTCFLFLTVLTGCAPASTAVNVPPVVTDEGAAPSVITPMAEATAAAEESATETPAAEATAVSIDDTIAYVQEQTLYINGDGEPIAVDTCPTDVYCILRYLKWSPDGQHLLYYLYDGEADSLRVADREGNVQVVAEEITFVMPGDWSPDGRAIAFLRPTDTMTEGSEIEPPVHVHEVLTAALDEAGVVQEPQVVGSTNRMPDGCGGGGRSQSEVLYENEGGTSYGYLMSVLEWTPSGVLLYTRNCGNVGINRFDMNSGADLESFEMELRNMVLDSSGEHWFAVTGPTWGTEADSHQLATGTPAETAVTIIPTSQPVELVFYGPTSGKLYYTVRELVERAELSDLGYYFAFFKSALWQLNADGSEETLLWEAEDQAFAQVTETAAGDVLFVRVENDRPFYEALQANPEIAPENIEQELADLVPQRHIVQLTLGGEPQMVIENAGQPTLAVSIK